MISIQIFTALIGILSTAHAAKAPPKVVVSSTNSPAYVIAKGKGMVTLVLNQGTGVGDAALNLVELKPGAELTEQVHSDSSEVLYIERGQIDLVVAGKPYKGLEGDAIYIPRGVKHSGRVDPGGKTVRLVQMYVGPGPEQRFTKQPKVH